MILGGYFGVVCNSRDMDTARIDRIHAYELCIRRAHAVYFVYNDSQRGINIPAYMVHLVPLLLTFCETSAGSRI